MVGFGLWLASATPVAANGGADLSIVKSADPNPVNAGDYLTYTLTITNAGPEDAHGVTVTDTLPVSVTFVQASDNCASSGLHAALCNVSALSVAAEASFTIVVAVDPTAGATIVNTATVSADEDDPYLADNQWVEETTVNHPALAVSKDTSTPVIRVGDAVTFTIAVTNTGDVTLSDVEVTDALVPDCSRPVGLLASQVVTQYTCSLVNVTADLTNTAVASGTPPVGAIVTATGSAAVDVISPSLALHKGTSTPVVRAGDAVTFTIAVTNTGDVTLSDVGVADALAPDCARPVGLLASQAVTQYTCSLVNVTADLTNTAVASGTPPVGAIVTATGSAAVDATNPSLAISKTPDLQVLRHGETAQFTITVTNTGDVPLQNVSWFDPLVPGCGGSTSQLSAGAYFVNYCSRFNVTADFTNVITATASAAGGLGAVSSDTARVDVIGPAVMLEKAPLRQLVRAGGAASFTITVTNNGDVDLEAVTVTDPNAAGCARLIGKLVTNTTTSYTCTVSAVTVGFTNVATVTGIPLDGTPVTHTAVATVGVIHPAIAVAKLPPAQKVRSGDAVTFTIRVTNTGDIALTGVAITDVLAPDCTRSVGSLAAGAFSQYICTRSRVIVGFTNAVTATGKPPVGSEVVAFSSAGVEVINPAISISKLPDLQTVQVGDPVTFTIVVTNSGDSPLANVAVTDAAAPACARGIGSLAPGETSSHTCTALNIVADFTNTATAAGTGLLGHVVSVSDIAVVRVTIPPPSNHPLYLPVVVKAEPLTQLFVTTEKTGGISRLELWRTSDNVLAHICENIPDNTVGHPCGAFAPGSYRIEARTARCGRLTTERTWGPGPVTIRVFCR
jgi:uncharacterized repeat protein (TIGR01451 family)